MNEADEMARLCGYIEDLPCLAPEEKPVERKHGDFFILFIDLYRFYFGLPNLNPEGRLTGRTKGRWLEQAKINLGEKWTLFLHQNQDLLQKIFTILERRCFVEEVIRFMFKRLSITSGDINDPAFQSFNEKCNHPLGVQAMAEAVWRDLEPCIEEAYQKMEEAGLNPKQFV